MGLQRIRGVVECPFGCEMEIEKCIMCHRHIEIVVVSHTEDKNPWRVRCNNEGKGETH